MRAITVRTKNLAQMPAVGVCGTDGAELMGRHLSSLGCVPLESFGDALEWRSDDVKAIIECPQAR